MHAGTVPTTLRVMPRYLIERRFHVAESEMPNVGRRSKRIAAEHFPEITWEHSHVVVDDSGAVTTFCVYGAPDEETLRQHAHELGQHDVATVHEIAGDVKPADFPL